MTDDTFCDNFNAYLDGDLPGSERLLFESHLNSCSDCRQALEQQTWIDDRLRLAFECETERPPSTILPAVRSRLAQRRRLTAACGLAAAAAVLMAIGWPMLSRQTIDPVNPNVAGTAAVEPAQNPPKATPTATFVSTTDAIVIPLESPAADVTVVQVFPTTETERRWRIELAIGSSTIPNGG